MDVQVVVTAAATAAAPVKLGTVTKSGSELTTGRIMKLTPGAIPQTHMQPLSEGDRCQDKPRPDQVAKGQEIC